MPSRTRYAPNEDCLNCGATGSVKVTITEGFIDENPIPTHTEEVRQCARGCPGVVRTY
jgi:hypothetical protein